MVQALSGGCSPLALPRLLPGRPLEQTVAMLRVPLVLAAVQRVLLQPPRVVAPAA